MAIYYRNGALLPDFSGPGIHTCTPFVTTVLQITVRPETKILDPMKCTTKDGVSNVFKNVQVRVYQRNIRINNILVTQGHLCNQPRQRV